MELTYNQLKKREVINITDGKSFGKIIDLTLAFPQGLIIGITVPGRKSGIISRIFDRSKVYIPKSNIVKIGGDVILVNLNCGDTCVDSVTTNKAKITPPPPPCPPNNGCPPHCPPPCGGCSGDAREDGFSGRIDLSDY